MPPIEDPERPPPGAGRDPERAANEAARRAATAIRRYSTANGCDRLWSLSYSNEFVPDSLGDVWTLHAETFRERLYELEGERFPMVLVPERGGETERPHLHMLTNRFIAKERVAQAWGMGWVDGRRITVWKDRDSGRVVNTRKMGGKERCRAAAGYLSSYVKKGFVEHHEFARHRYSTSRGFGAVSRQARFLGVAAARTWCSLTMPGRLVSSWSSSECEAWDRPPVEIWFYDDN